MKSNEISIYWERKNDKMSTTQDDNLEQACQTGGPIACLCNAA
jgi:hypothetical protein